MSESPRQAETVTDGAELKRRANELMRSALVNGVVDATPYFCECDDPACLRPVWLTNFEYDLSRRRPGWRPLSPDHSSPARVA